MSIDGFIPEIWSASLLKSLAKSQKFAQPQVVNRNYEGDISNAGDTVRVNSVSGVTIGTYTKNSDITTETLTGTQATLDIDHADYYSFQVDDVDSRQAAGAPLEAAFYEAAQGLADVCDKAIGELYPGAAGAVGASDAGIALTEDGAAYQGLIDLSVVLDNQHVPTEGRFVVVPPFFAGLLLTDNKFVGSGALPADVRLATGQVGEAAGFAVIKSPNVAAVTGGGEGAAGIYAIMGGTPAGISYASQISAVEAYRMESRFADGVKGLHLWGADVIQPEALATLYVELAVAP